MTLLLLLLLVDAPKGESILLAVLSLLNSLLPCMSVASLLKVICGEVEGQSSALVCLLLNPPPNLAFLKSLTQTLLHMAARIGTASFFFFCFDIFGYFSVSG